MLIRHRSLLERNNDNFSRSFDAFSAARTHFSLDFSPAATPISSKSDFTNLQACHGACRGAADGGQGGAHC